jgi:two-component system cell cycle response regulator DivK
MDREIMKVLYVEDNPQNMRLVRKMLQVGGYTMIEAMDGNTGLALATREVPDLILMDINLPDIDGMEVTSRIKSDPNLAHIPIIALTANAMYGDRERFLAAGCDGYLAKPVSKTELLNTLSCYLGYEDVQAARVS